MGKKIDGKQIALQIRKEVQQKNEAFAAKPQSSNHGCCGPGIPTAI